MGIIGLKNCGTGRDTPNRKNFGLPKPKREAVQSQDSRGYAKIAGYDWGGVGVGRK